ncbi:MAG: (d)CMP kinase, partial [Clostridia bacterium]|nr:(d)CMP kinase [Clostridia bacterium]
MNKRYKYAIVFLIVLVIEILIGVFVHDSFVRPFVGDVLVVILIWSGLRIFLPEKPRYLSPFVFVFAAACELLQLADIVSLLGITNPVLKTIIGTRFDINDIWCYLLGCIIILEAEIIVCCVQQLRIFEKKYSLYFPDAAAIGIIGDDKKERNRPMTINVAIDGPAGAGKSTIAKECAKRLGFIYTDTGALYRAIGLYVHSLGKDCSDVNDVIPCLKFIDLRLSYNDDGEQIVLLNLKDVSKDIRKPEISIAASQVSAIPQVRDFLLELQRSIAAKDNVIMDGRDIGTVILPNAQIKIFLTASPEMRAKRRYDELIAKGQQVEYDDVLNDIIKRDEHDSNRSVAPLRPAEDSIT